MSTLHERETDLSVIIPVYNLERFLTPMLDSLKEQDLGEYNIENIFVLNNCTDASENVIRESGLNCTIINCTEQGCGPARNAGFEIATGKYIWYMDGDDWLLRDDAIRMVLDKATAEDPDIMWIPYASDRFQYLYFSMVWQYLLRRDFVKEFRFPAIQPCEDDAYMEQVFNKARYSRYSYFREMPCVEEALYFYNYMREGSNMYRHFHGEKI